MLQESVLGLLRKLGQQMHATNMELESLLGLIKASSPYARQHTTAERVCYAGTLTQLMHHFCKAGGEDNRKLTFRALDQLAAPVRKRRQQESHLASGRVGMTSDTSRVRLCYINKQVTAFLAAHPEANKVAIDNKRREFAVMWRDLPPAERALETIRFQEAEIQDDQDAGPAPDPVNPLGTHGPPPGLDGQRWPVAESNLKDLLRNVPLPSNGIGVRNRALAARQRHCNECFVTNQQAIPDSEKFTLRRSCWQAHPGVCVSRDRCHFSATHRLHACLVVFGKKVCKPGQFVLFRARGQAGVSVDDVVAKAALGKANLGRKLEKKRASG